MKSASKITLTIEELTALTKAALGSSVIEYTELTEGWFNTIYSLKLENHQQVVLKLAPPPGFRVMRYEAGLMGSEVEVLRLLEDEPEVPLPKVLAHDSSGSVHPHEYFLMEYLPGDSCGGTLRSELPKNVREALDAQIAAISLGMNAVKGERFGRIRSDNTSSHSWFESFLAMMDDLLADAHEKEVPLPFSPDSIRQVVMDSRNQLQEVSEPRLVHWDLHPGNILLEAGRVSGILDCDRALWGDPLMEWYFRSIVETPEVFLEEYCRTEPIPDRLGADRCIYLYDLYHALIMLIECRFRDFDNKHTAWCRNQLQWVVSNSDLNLIAVENCC